jgi:hypothetical protein
MVMKTWQNPMRFPLAFPVIDVCLAVVIITVASGAMRFFEEESKARDACSGEAWDHWRRRVAELQTRYDALLRERNQSPALDDASAAAPNAQQQLDELATLQQQIKDLQARLEQVHHDRAESERLAGEFEQMMQELRESRARHLELQERIAALQEKSAVVIEVHPVITQPDGLRPRSVVISEATVTPVCEPY